MLLLLSMPAPAESAHPEDTRYSPAELMSDLIQLQDALRQNHPHLYRYCSKGHFEASFDHAAARLNHPMTAAEFLGLLRPLVARVGCMHTSIQPSEAYSQEIFTPKYKLFPFRLAFIGGRAFVLENFSSDPTIVRGTEVLSLNERPISEVYTRILQSLSADGRNMTFKIWRLNNGYAGGLVASCLGYPDRYVVECIRPGRGEVTRPTIEGRTLAELPPVLRSQRTEVGPGSFGLRIVDSLHTAVLRVRTFLRDPANEFGPFMARAFHQIRDNGVKSLIIDVRGNPGGAPENAADLLAYLAPSPYLYFSRAIPQYASFLKPVQPHPLRFGGRVYVLMDGGCASTTGHFLSLIRFNRLGILIGEESGGSFTCNDNSTYVVLSHTKLRLRVARSEFQTAVHGFTRGRGVMPDYEVKLTKEDVLADNDRMIDFALELAKRDRTGSAPATWGRVGR